MNVVFMRGCGCTQNYFHFSMGYVTLLSVYTLHLQCTKLFRLFQNSRKLDNESQKNRRNGFGLIHYHSERIPFSKLYVSPFALTRLSQYTDILMNFLTIRLQMIETANRLGVWLIVEALHTFLFRL